MTVSGKVRAFGAENAAECNRTIDYFVYYGSHRRGQRPGFTLRPDQEIREQRADIGRRRVLLVFAIALLIAPVAAGLRDTVAFADFSPEVGNPPLSAEVDDQSIRVAEANLPAVGSVDDYMRQDDDGPPSAGVPPNGYSQPAMPPPSASRQGIPQQEWGYRYPDPDAARTALIGAAVVGALAVGMWALQQHELHQAQARQHARKRASADRPAYRY